MTTQRSRIIPAATAQHIESWQPNQIAHKRGPEPQQAVRAIDMAELQERALEEARAEGYQQGLQEGYNAGEHWVQQESQRMWALLTEAEKSLHDLQASICDSVLDLAIDLARQIVRHEVSVDRDVILNVVRESLDQLVGTGSHPQLFISPQDSDIVRREFSDELQLDHWKIIEDPRISPGGCRISTGLGDIDAQVMTRWQRTVSALGKSAQYELLDPEEVSPAKGGSV